VELRQQQMEKEGDSLLGKALKTDRSELGLEAIMSKYALSQTLVMFVLTTLITVVPIATVNVRAQSSGLVCVGEMPTPSCPSFAPTFGPQFPAGEADFNVVSSQAFNGFDISVRVDPAILNATGFNLGGNAFQRAGGTVSIVTECINGHPITGNCRSQDGPGVATVAVTSNVLVTGSGHLYNISYHVLGSGTTPVAYQSGCTGTSNDSACVTLVNTNTIVPENLQGATFTSGDFSLVTTPSSQAVTPGSSTSFTVTVTSMNGFTGNVRLGAVVSPVVSQGPMTSLNPTLVNLPTNGSQATSTLTVSTTSSTPTGTFTIFATGTSCSGCGPSHSYGVTLVVRQPDFSISANPGSQNVVRGSTATFMVTVTSLSFTGIVNLTATVSPTVRKGPTTSLSPTSVSLVSDGSATSILTVSTSRSTPQGILYTITVTGASGSIRHSASVTLIVIK